MTTKFVCKLNDLDEFSLPDYKIVNLNDSSQFHYTIWNRNKQMLYSLPHFFQKEALDLFYISLMVFYVDRTVSRKNQNDSWTRHFFVCMPVLMKGKWDLNKTLLEKALNFLTGDIWSFDFRNRPYDTESENLIKRGRSRFRNSIKKIDTNTFCMLSGGLDSFIGAINLLTNGVKPIFVGNYNGGKGVSVYQNKVINILSDHFHYSKGLFYQFYAAPLKGIEESTRSRSFMFFSHAILLASCMDHPVDLCIPENGVISLNIPLTIHRAGSLSTRTTHPYYISLLKKILKELNISVNLYNPFQFLTKGEMMLQCLDFDFLKNNYQWTMSCSHPDLGRWKGESGSSHCGVCLPCTIRRAAIKKAGIDDNSIYRDKYFSDSEAKLNLKSYKLGLAHSCNPILAIQKNGPIIDRQSDYAELYQRGRNELKELLDTIQ